MPLYTPDELLPIYPTYSTVVRNGVKYKAYFETDWHQVITEDGVPLCELIQSMPSFSATNFYKYCGIFKSTPAIAAIDQLYALTTQKIGDVYLVETDMVAEGGKVCESYVWLGEESGWVYCGTTNRKVSINRDLPEVIRLFPTELGEPGQVLVVSEDGKSLVWGTNSNNNDNTNNDMYPDFSGDNITSLSSTITIFHDTIHADAWTYNGEYPCFEYIYQSEKLPINSYFEITPVIECQQDVQNVGSCGISPIYKIQTGKDGITYCTLRAKRVPNIDIPICVKSFGTINEI